MLGTTISAGSLPPSAADTPATACATSLTNLPNNCASKNATNTAVTPCVSVSLRGTADFALETSSGLSTDHLLRDLLRQVAFFADLFHEVQLRLEPVDRVFLALQNAFEEFTGPVVAFGDAQCDGLVQAFHGCHFER